MATLTTILSVACVNPTPVFDFDGDGTVDSEDCQPADPLIHPTADDSFGDNIDQNCDGTDGNAIDSDADSFAASLDCDDRNPFINPAADDPVGDGIDQNCDGLDGLATDQDMDRYSSAVDCNDNDPNIHPGAEEINGDGVDQNCDGLESLPVDLDFDGFFNDLDCDDEDGNSFPGAEEIEGDGIDQNCDSVDGVCTVCAVPEPPAQSSFEVSWNNLTCTQVTSFDLDNITPSFSFHTEGSFSTAWHLYNGEGHDSQTSLYYGNLSNNNFDDGHTLGTITTDEAFATFGGPVLELSFWVLADVDTRLDADLLCARVAERFPSGIDDPQPDQLCVKNQYDFSGAPSWQQHSLLFPGSNSHDVSIEFLFDSVDDLDNSGQGIFIDDVVLKDCS